MRSIQEILYKLIIEGKIARRHDVFRKKHIFLSKSKENHTNLNTIDHVKSREIL